MRLPPNYGPRYTNDFMRMFRDIATAAQRGARAVPASVRGAEADTDAGGRPASQPRKRSLRCSIPCGRSSRRLLQRKR